VARRFAGVWPQAAAPSGDDVAAWSEPDREAAPPGDPPKPPGRSALGPFDPGRRGVRALVVVAILVVLCAAYLAWRSQPHAEPVPPVVSAPPSVAPPGPSSVPGGAAAPSGTIVVAVQGKVRRPGLVRLATGARVADAIEAAGGAQPEVDLSFVNLARRLADGELIVIGATPPPGVAAPGAADPGAPAAPAGKLDLNAATVAQLDTLPGIGPALAQRIVAFRTQHGGFRSVDDLHQVPGIGDAKFAEIKDLVTV
jgi:competence protein ComEA